MKPFLTIAICTFNRANLLPRALESVRNQTQTNVDLEILIVDNGSTDHTRDVVAAVQADDSRVRYVVEPNAGIAHARNRAFNEARGEYLAFLDDDAWAEDDWLENLLGPIKSSTPAPECVVGPVSLVWEDKKPEWFPTRFESLLCRYDMGDSPRFLDASGYLLTTNSLFHRQTLLALGGVRADLGHKRNQLLGGEDNEIFQRLIANGYRVFYQPGARVNHPVPKARQTRRFLLRRLFWDGASQPLVGYQAGTHQRSSTRPWSEFRIDARRSVRFAFEILRETITGNREGAADGLYRLVQRAGRMRTHFIMALGAPGVNNLRPNRIATFAPLELGDTILATPLYRAVRATYPEAHFTVLSQLPEHPVLEGFDIFDAIVNYDPKMDLARDFDLVVLPVLCGDSDVRRHFEIHPNVISADRLHAVKRGSLVNSWNGKYSHVLFHKHQVEMNMELAYEAGYRGQTAAPHCPQGNSHEFKQHEGKIGLFINTPVNEFQAMTNRQWPMKHWNELIDRLGVRNIVLIGGSTDRPNVEQLAEHTSAPFVVTSSLAEFTTLCRVLKMLVTTDGGAMHAAATSGVPIVSLHGTSSPILLHPWIYPDGKCIAILSPNTCSPCQRSYRLQACESGLTRMNCMQNIQAEFVERATIEVDKLNAGTCLIMKGNHLMTKDAYLKSWKRAIEFALNYNMSRVAIRIMRRSPQGLSTGGNRLENSKAGN